MLRAVLGDKVFATTMFIFVCALGFSIPWLLGAEKCSTFYQHGFTLKPLMLGQCLVLTSDNTWVKPDEFIEFERDKLRNGVRKFLDADRPRQAPYYYRAELSAAKVKLWKM